MNRYYAAALTSIGMAIVGACGPSNDAATKAPAAATSTNTDSGDVNPQDPKAGLNTNRPDGDKDVKPESGTNAGAK